MANTIPIQTRAVDPYTEFNSNAVNETSRIISKRTNCILSNDAIDIISDSTSPLDHVVVTSGSCIKDDVLITITTNFRVDFTDSDFYVAGPPFNEAGNYYVVLDYTYTKSKPAPEASIKILKPSQHALLTSSYLLLKVVNVIYTGAVFNISSFADYDDITPSNKRLFTQTYATLESYLPAFNSLTDRARVIYDLAMDIMYIGDNDSWKEFGTLDYQCDTTLCSIGQLVYIGGANIAHPAIATSISSFATAFVVEVGNPGKVRITGVVSGGLVQTGITLSAGDTLYLSITEAGKVTNVIPSAGTTQIVGTCISTTGSDYSTVLASLSGVEGNVYHNSLLGLQGGGSTERYHLTLSQYNNIGDGTHNQLSGTQGGTLTERYHFTQSQHDNLGDGTHNQISGTQGGTLTERYHFTLSEHTALVAFGGNHNNAPDGLQGGSSTERYHLTQSQHDNLGDGTHNGLSGLQGGSVSERYHLTSSQYTNVVALPTGTRLLFAQSSAPSGWTQVVTWNDRVIRVTSGSGGGTGGSWTISGLAGASHTHTTGGHSLSLNEMPMHNHTIAMYDNAVPPAQALSHFNAYSYIGDTTTGWSGGSGTPGVGDSHTHGDTGTPSSTTVTSSGAWRPAYLDVIVCQKN